MTLLKILTSALIFVLIGCNDAKEIDRDSKYKPEPALPFGISWDTNFSKISSKLININLERFDDESKMSFYSFSNNDEFLAGMDSYNLIVEEDGVISALNFAQFFSKNEQRAMLNRYEEIKNELKDKYNITEKKERLKNNKTVFKCLSNETCGIMYSVFNSKKTTVLVRAYGLENENGMLQVIVFPRDGHFSISS
ncbi:hypothetical protein [Enterobacter hormaechei]|uniref:hypothetical protein n=1 Tax=Enterobacter hormaechei TaxID=158836 RepID=UPI0024DE5DF3|nr:hypothetical protein [Enterobacter hormaechei]MDK2357148.1 hypothetical protein [Enterobacter hormaechei]